MFTEFNKHSTHVSLFFFHLHHGSNSLRSLADILLHCWMMNKSSLTALSRWLVKSPAAWTVEFHSLKLNTKQFSTLENPHENFSSSHYDAKCNRRVAWMTDHSHSNRIDQTYQQINSRLNSIFSYLFFADNLRYCDVPSGGSCCTTQMEMKAAQSSRQVMEKNTRDAIQKMSSTLSTRATKFHGE